MKLFKQIAEQKDSITKNKLNTNINTSNKGMLSSTFANSKMVASPLEKELEIKSTFV